MIGIKTNRHDLSSNTLARLYITINPLDRPTKASRFAKQLVEWNSRIANADHCARHGEGQYTRS
jgi:hypothetical protein